LYIQHPKPSAKHTEGDKLEATKSMWKWISFNKFAMEVQLCQYPTNKVSDSGGSAVWSLESHYWQVGNIGAAVYDDDIVR
jgi:hypothetical protein